MTDHYDTLHHDELVALLRQRDAELAAIGAGGVAPLRGGARVRNALDIGRCYASAVLGQMRQARPDGQEVREIEQDLSAIEAALEAA